MDLLSHFLSIQESMKKIRQYEKEEQNKDTTYHIKKLPTDLSKYIFTYLSLNPFDKQEFKDYFKYKHGFYKDYREGNNFSSRNDFIVCFNNRQGRNIENPYHGQTRIVNTIYEFNFYTQKKSRIKSLNHLVIRRFMFPFIDFYPNKMVLKELIDKHMTKIDIQNALRKINTSTKFVCRMKKEELEKVFKVCLLSKD